MLQSQTVPLSVSVKTRTIATAVPTAEQPAASSILLCPGEGTTLLVQITNRSNRRISIALQTDSSCPADWYRLGLEGREILPFQKMDVALYFKVPINFFEAADALKAKDTLTLDYQLKIVVTYQSVSEQSSVLTSNQQEALDPVVFNLHVRPPAKLLKYLPVIYQEVDFISRLLHIFEQGLNPIIFGDRQLWAYLDPLTAPTSMLPFLAHWVGWPFDPSGDIAQQRHLIRNAMEIYRWRGTRHGLRLMLHLHTGLPMDEQTENEADKNIAILEPHQKRFSLKSSRLDNSVTLGRGTPYHFVVRLRSIAEGKPLNEEDIRQLIEREKPACCSYELFIE